jgi:diaminohydroxyphosphoribosylaminopyrimidine deaminase/5-amino-6-(5-phosphoribosylamino)uracil reductase
VLVGYGARRLFVGLNIDVLTQRGHLRIVESRRFGDEVRLLLPPRREEEPL